MRGKTSEMTQSWSYLRGKCGMTEVRRHYPLMSFEILCLFDFYVFCSTEIKILFMQTSGLSAQLGCCLLLGEQVPEI